MHMVVGKRSILDFYRFGNKVMDGQSKISKFFQPLGQKRVNCSTQDNDALCNKKSKTANGMEKVSTLGKENDVGESLDCTSPVKGAPVPVSPSLSPEQKQQMEQNHLQAKAKLLKKNTHGVVVDVGDSWMKALHAEFSKPYFLQLCEFVSAERQKHTVYPPTNQVFTWTNMCAIREVKVVILGQDPYHGPGQAHGLCFSVQKGVAPPPSLINMYKELTNDIEGFVKPNHGCLSGWSRQGVLLLNTVLTVRAHQANSHKDRGWEKFTDAVVSWLNKNMSGLVFILWGSHAQKKGASIDKKKHHVLKGVHPSPLSAHRGYFGCKHFSQTNELLKKEGRKPIDWSDLPPE